MATPPAPSAEVKAPKPKRLTKPPRRQSVPPVSVAAPEPRPRPPATRRVSAPVDLTPILSTQSVDNNPTRRVYFADRPMVSPFIRRNTTPDLPSPAKTQSMFQSIHSVVSGGSRPSSPALPPKDLDINQASGDTCSILEAPESDSSRPPSRSSLFRASVGLQKLKFGMKPRSESLDRANDKADQNSIASADTAGSDKSSRRFSYTFPLTRPRNAIDLTIDTPAPSPSRISFRRGPSPARPSSSPSRCASPLPSASDLLSPTFLRKSQKRASVPIPRTMPYGAPYFATPPAPIVPDIINQPGYPNTSSQTNEDTNDSRKSSLDSDSEVSRGRSIKRITLNCATRTGPKRKSASIDLVQITQKCT
ncbi:hypothetical protein CPB83DRAFT_46035 [Crepidotus variabilis]|uniref:Uncharacterized protein n=1 Tax=Crepidotus variabilis TaxID=179855 RepID=A0A9P6EMM6_9AGAR|nr:hypothetical protein CPB83DRAFT_46035 [Crepidotus variabilis]